MANRPGVMLYFDSWLPLLELEDKTVAELFRAVIRYGKYGEVPEFQGVCGILWGIIAPQLDRDDERYQETVTQKQYAGYCSAEKRAGRDPLPRNLWQQMLTPVDERQPTTTPISTTTSTPTTNPTPISNSVPAGKGIAKGSGEREGENPDTSAADDFERQRQRAIRLLEQSG